MLLRLISHGGCGTAWFLNGIKLSLPAGWITHSRDPNIENFEPYNIRKMIYLYGDPYNTILSYHRRGFISDPDAKHCRHMNGDYNGLIKFKSRNLQGFLNNGYDFFRLEDHVNTWMNYTNRKYKIMFVKYESLPQTLPEITKWLGIEDRQLVPVKRISDWEKSEGKVKDGLHKMFGKYRERWLQFEDLIVL